MSVEVAGVYFRMCSVWSMGIMTWLQMCVQDAVWCLFCPQTLMVLSLLAMGTARQLSNAHVCIYFHVCFNCVCLWALHTLTDVEIH